MDIILILSNITSFIISQFEIAIIRITANLNSEQPKKNAISYPKDSGRSPKLKVALIYKSEYFEIDENDIFLSLLSNIGIIESYLNELFSLEGIASLAHHFGYFGFKARFRIVD